MTPEYLAINEIVPLQTHELNDKARDGWVLKHFAVSPGKQYSYIFEKVIPSVRTYEYKVEERENAHRAEAFLDRMDKQGWELIAVVPYVHEYRDSIMSELLYHFRRVHGWEKMADKPKENA